MRLQHQTRRDGIILVGGAKYELDAEGCVEVTEEHGELLLQGAKWKPLGVWTAQDAKIREVTPPIVSGARRPRTQEELRGLAEASGLPVKEEDKPTPDPEPLGEPEEEEEEVEVSMDMKKSELVELAETLGLDPSGMTKSEIIELIEQSQE
jgi:hypothetical protein